jgi:hypothetical protein
MKTNRVDRLYYIGVAAVLMVLIFRQLEWNTVGGPFSSARVWIYSRTHCLQHVLLLVRLIVVERCCQTRATSQQLEELPALYDNRRGGYRRRLPSVIQEPTLVLGYIVRYSSIEIFIYSRAVMMCIKSSRVFSFSPFLLFR